MSELNRVQIEIFSDPICPWCFIGKRRLERALGQVPSLRPAITWLPFQLNPDMPAHGMARQSYLERKFGGVAQAREVYAPIEAAGITECIEFRFEAIERTPNTLPAHRLIHFARAQPAGQDAVVEALFASYFLRGEDIGALDVLALCAQEAGLDAQAVWRYLQSDADVDRVRAQDRQARELGIQGVPLFVVARRHAVSGAQPPEAFLEVFESLGQPVATDAPSEAG